MVLVCFVKRNDAARREMNWKRVKQRKTVEGKRISCAFRVAGVLEGDDVRECCSVFGDGFERVLLRRSCLAYPSVSVGIPNP